MARVNLGPAQLDLVNLVAGRPHTLTLTCTDETGASYTPAASEMAVYDMAGALRVTVTPTITPGSVVYEFDTVTALPSALYTHEVTADGIAWLKGRIELRAAYDGRGFTKTPVGSASITVGSETTVALDGVLIVVPDAALLAADGGAPSSGASITYDGSSPSTTPTVTLDGGAP